MRRLLARIERLEREAASTPSVPLMNPGFVKPPFTEENLANCRRMFEEFTAEALARDPHAMDEFDRALEATVRAIEALRPYR